MTVLKFLVVLLYYFFLCVWVFRLYVFLGNTIVWYPGKSEMGIESHRTGATEVSYCMGAGNWPWFFWKSVIFLQSLCLGSETGSHISQVNLELTVLLRTTLDFWSSCVIFRELGWWLHTTVSGLCGAVAQTQSLTHAGQTFYQLSYILSSSF